MMRNKCKRPGYPNAELRNGDFGVVKLGYLIDRDGGIIERRIESTSGSAQLDVAALDAYAKCPAVAGSDSDGQPIQSWLQVEHDWAVVVPPKVDPGHCEQPIYPPESISRNEVGLVRLKFLINADGIVEDRVVEQTSGYPPLDKAALEGLEKCRFVPGTRNGRPAKDWARLEYAWVFDTADRVDFAYPFETVATAGEANAQVKLPTNLTYYGLNATQRKYVRGLFENLPADHEPPYPVNGLSDIYWPFYQVQVIIGEKGKLSMSLNVNAQGKVDGVRFSKAPSRQVRKLAEKIAADLRFKPARCGGTPCAMEFPVELLFSSNRLAQW